MKVTNSNIASLACARQLLSHVSAARPPPRLATCTTPCAWAPKQSPISSPLCSHLRSTALVAFSPLYLPPSISVPSVEHCRWEPLLPPHAPPCHHRLGARSPSRPPLGANQTPPLMSLPSDQATPPTGKDLHDVRQRRSSSGLISTVLSIARTPNHFPIQQRAPNYRRSPPPRRFPPADHTPLLRALLR
jgi:hypothetical protein